jgi:nitrite reductase/ring-hydroxylating ferredoxin subunit
VAEYVRVGRSEDFREGHGRAVNVGGRRIAVFRVRGKLHALQDACPHMGAALSDGRLLDDQVVCHWHGWSFDLVTGQGHQGARSWARARVFEVREEGHEVLVLRPDEPPPARNPAEDEEWIPWDPDRHLKPPKDR